MTSETMRNDYAMANPKSLRPSGYNPNVLNGDQCRQLFEEIQRQGRLLKPVVCRRGPDGDLIIIDGEHNWEAARMAGLTAIPIEVVEVNDFEARRQTFVRNLNGSWHKVRLGRMFADMLARRGLSNRDLAAELGCSEGTVRNTLLYARAADLCAGREGCPDEDAIANMTIKRVRDLIAELEGIANEAEAKPKPGDAPEEARILARLKRAWGMATPDERREFLEWCGATADVEQLVQEARVRGFSEGHDLAKKAEKASAKAKYNPEADARRDLANARANGEARNAYAERGARIREARQERGLTAKALAELAGLAHANIVSMVELARLTKSGGPAAGRPAFAKLEAALGLTP